MPVLFFLVGGTDGWSCDSKMVALIREDLRTPLFRLMAGVILIFLKSAIYLFCTTTKKSI